jgi:hypothetical protein
MSTRDPKRNYTVEDTTTTTSSNTDVTKDTTASDATVEKTDDTSADSTVDSQQKQTSSVENQPTTKPVRKLEVRKKSRTLAELKSELKASEIYCKKLGNDPKRIAKAEAEDAEKLQEVLKNDPNATLIDKKTGKNLIDDKDDVEDAVPRPFRRCRKNGLLQTLFNKINARNQTTNVQSGSDAVVPSTSTQPKPAESYTPYKPTLYEQPRMNIDVDFENNVTSFDNTLTSIRIKHPPRQLDGANGLSINGTGLNKKKKSSKKTRKTKGDEDEDCCDDDDDEDDDEDYDPEEDEDDDDDEEDEYEPPVEGLPKNVIYSLPEEKWIKDAPEDVQKDIVERENKLAKVQLSEKPLRFRVLQSPNLSDRSKANIIRMIDDMNESMPFGGDFSKMNQRMNMLEKIPFDNYIQPVITSKDTPDKIGKYLMDVKDTMDKAVFGHSQAKQQIISILAREISNPKSVGNVFAIQGPMGNGKTTLAKEGICKAMGRPFAFISLGGMQDSAHFTGHSYTYEGSKPGRIVEILIETGCMNPVIYFDELDKVSETKHGEEIIHLLCHLTDTSQNSSFQDKYFSGIEFDLSKATFIFSYNDESRINPILLDRMIKIRTDGFDADSKMVIAKNYLIPNLRAQFQFSEADIEINDEVLRQIMSQYTHNEKGVRNLKRCLDAIMAKCNILRYIPADHQKTMGLAVKGFKMPYKMTLESLSQFIEKDEQVNPSVAMMYM